MHDASLWRAKQDTWALVPLQEEGAMHMVNVKEGSFVLGLEEEENSVESGGGRMWAYALHTAHGRCKLIVDHWEPWGLEYCSEGANKELEESTKK